MKKTTGQIVAIPQLRIKRTLYIENGERYIRLNGMWWELNEYKTYLKDKFSINISYLIEGDAYEDF